MPGYAVLLNSSNIILISWVCFQNSRWSQQASPMLAASKRTQEAVHTVPEGWVGNVPSCGRLQGLSWWATEVRCPWGLWNRTMGWRKFLRNSSPPKNNCGAFSGDLCGSFDSVWIEKKLKFALWTSLLIYKSSLVLSRWLKWFMFYRNSSVWTADTVKTPWNFCEDVDL